MQRESGATMTEYVLMVALIAVVVVAAILIFEGMLTGNLNESIDCVESIGTSAASECPDVPESE